ncbi:pantoate--beta-alanine ligase [Leucobacter weissii]|uniref:Pantothenate synthetase n=1 Tax=Leucobacter weissii TaxID=1983706 RepID=A0A939SBG9_9MICO|nr:pantoate--beta-alanine ligase [Leucobacter weissii]MBO1901363.1 pantoate--beta-alanine ligase [Leucobacter weissii]
MRIIRTAAELRARLEPLRSGGIGFVPTMGALHEGHLSLLRAARAAHGTVVLSIFVNPAQFDRGEDLAAYPRDEARDIELAEASGVDLLFAPEAGEIYPPGFRTTVSVGGAVAESLEGAARGRAHFDGVATVVSKLLILVRPDAAYFGRKDFQQLLLVRRLVADLGLPTRIVGCPTVREPDGLARSSRNVGLGPEERRLAAAVPAALSAAVAAVRQGVADAEEIRIRAGRALDRPGLGVEYLALVHPETLEPVAVVTAPTVLAVAVRIGATRLIDNELLDPAPIEG